MGRLLDELLEKLLESLLETFLESLLERQPSPAQLSRAQRTTGRTTKL